MVDPPYLLTPDTTVVEALTNIANELAALRLTLQDDDGWSVAESLEEIAKALTDSEDGRRLVEVAQEIAQAIEGSHEA